MHLLAVILLSGMHYTAYARNGIDTDSHWFYFDSLGPEVFSGISSFQLQQDCLFSDHFLTKKVQRVPGLGPALHNRLLSTNQDRHGQNKQFGSNSRIRDVTKIERNNHICIYLRKDE